MQPDFGTATYNPNGQFAFTRSYIQFVEANVVDAIATYVGGLMTLFYPSFDVVELIVFRDYFHPWSSNSYTLDGIVSSIAYYFVSDPTTIYPGGISVTYWTDADPPAPRIIITPDGHGGTRYPFALPMATPGTYWLAQ